MDSSSRKRPGVSGAQRLGVAPDPEETLIRAAEEALRRGDDAAASAILEQHAREFPEGKLKVTAEALKSAIAQHHADELREGKLMTEEDSVPAGQPR
jgi:hypothetical protein